MVGLGWAEILILLFCTGVFVIGPLAIVLVVLATRRPGDTPPLAAPSPHRPPLPNRNSLSSDDADARQTIIARLTQRFCPQCRAPLDRDAPEGLCPACLMAGGLASAVIAPPVNGLAATTPPSGSQPPATGEWADLSQHFPQLEVLELLGRGGMGSVYKARQKNLDRIVALKVIPPEAAKDPAFTERFNREAKAMARMNHPNIVTVYDFGQAGEVFFLLMEYVDGVNLRHAMRAGHLDAREALAIVPQICDALQYAHNQNVVHRDIKPENILLDRSGRVKIADFGLAKLLGNNPNDFTLTRTQQVMGTPRYMAPEQIERPAAVDHRADIYSLGVVLYEMLTGELPLGRFEPPSHKVEVDVRIDQVVLRALEKSPERRYQRASEVKTELASAASWPALAPFVAAPIAAAVVAPVWRTPSPASKNNPTDYPIDPGGIPLGQVLMVALGMVMGVLMMGGGIAAGIYAMTWGFHGYGSTYWGWMGTAFGCIVGGFGSTAGSYNTYRQMAGAEDLMRSPRVTWFDRVMRVYLGTGLAILALGIYFVFDVTNDETRHALLLLGGIATLQGGLFVFWRALARPAAEPGAQAAAAGQSIAAGPGTLRAVIWPTLAMAAVFAILLADVHFALPIPSPTGPSTPRMIAYRWWYEAIVIAGLVTVPLCFLALGAWRTFGPRQVADDGHWAVPVPFGHPAWLWAIAGLAALSLFLPWFRLEVWPDARVELPFDEVYAGPRENGDIASRVVLARDLQTIAAMPTGWRYSHRGLQHGHFAAPACLLIFFAMLSAFALQPRHPARIGFLLITGAVALLIVTMILHEAANQQERIVVDDATATGLGEYASRARGVPHRTIDPWRQAAAPGFTAEPAIGVLALLVACGLAIFVGATELSWGAVLPAGKSEAAAQPAGVQQKLADVDPVRAAVLGKVAGPGIGLIIAGLLGFLPILLALLAVPAWTLRPMPGKSMNREPLEFLDGALPSPVEYPQPPPGLIPLAAPALPMGSLAVGVRLPGPILAQATESRPLWAISNLGILGLMFVFNLAFSITLILGGWRMRQAKSYGLSMIAAIVALLPCTFGWILGLPIGIWALIVLMDPEVKAGFDS